MIKLIHNLCSTSHNSVNLSCKLVITTNQAPVLTLLAFDQSITSLGTSTRQTEGKLPRFYNFEAKPFPHVCHHSKSAYTQRILYILFILHWCFGSIQYM